MPRPQLLSGAGLLGLDLDWGGFAELAEAVRDDVRYLQERPEVCGAQVERWIYEVERRSLERLI